MLVFIPAVGEYVIPELLGGPDSIMIGRVVWMEFFNNRDWPVASALAVIILLILILPIIWFHKHQNKEGIKRESATGYSLKVAHGYPCRLFLLPVRTNAVAGDLFV
ncbi:hypothetical protein ERHA55_15760 [Erwinia rhapontici]|nr:hypothetical protein ERHA55_15760 [Erwinia rhapontici]